MRVVCLLELNRYGHLEIDVLSARRARRFSRASLYLQVDYDVVAFLQHLPRRVARDLEAGWPVRTLLSTEYFE